MTDDPFELLRDHVRRQAELIEPGTGTDELIAHITLEHPRSPSAALVPRRRRRWIPLAVGAVVCAGIGAGAAVTATRTETKTVEHPELGVFCRGSASAVGGTVISIDADPIGDCRALWASGALPLGDGVVVDPIPALVACVNRHGVMEVLPGDGSSACTSYGMAVADVATAVTDPRLELADDLAEASMRCLPEAEAVDAVEALLVEHGFDGWDVVVRAGPGCSIINIHPTLRETVEVVLMPRSD